MASRNLLRMNGLTKLGTGIPQAGKCSSYRGGVHLAHPFLASSFLLIKALLESNVNMVRQYR
jgi:hypothetical protein